MLLVLVTVLG